MPKPLFRPIHVHDCDNCQYLGSDIDLEVDYYIHKNENVLNTTLISRYGVEGDYSSGTEFYGINPYITAAGNLAVDQGHITLDEIAQHLRQQIDHKVIIPFPELKGNE